MKYILTKSQFKKLCESFSIDDFNNRFNSDPKTEKKKDKDSKFIQCKNCKKKFTQTIYKGKKSLPICPHCGTHNQKDKDESNK